MHFPFQQQFKGRTSLSLAHKPPTLNLIWRCVLGLKFDPLAITSSIVYTSLLSLLVPTSWNDWWHHRQAGPEHCHARSVGWMWKHSAQWSNAANLDLIVVLSIFMDQIETATLVPAPTHGSELRTPGVLCLKRPHILRALKVRVSISSLKLYHWSIPVIGYMNSQSYIFWIQIHINIMMV